ncbi:MAG: hypothetical protein V4628_10680 [Pseudomonadota bacterium]
MNGLTPISVFLLIIIIGLIALLTLLKKKKMLVWIGSYILQRLSGKPKVNGPVHVMFCFVDHYEPQWGRVKDIEIERNRVDRWCDEYPRMVAKHKDADGNYPKHTFFYPEEEYRKEHIDKLIALCNKGYGEVEVHLHHDNDTSANLRTTLNRFADCLHQQHQALPRNKLDGRLQYGFIHGNWCLDNSRDDGRMCGVNDELIILKETGCYADFTLPSAPSDTQTKKINSIYYATDNPHKAKSHNTGVDVEVNKKPSGDLMIIQGPLCLNWRNRKGGFLPRIEAGDIRQAIPPSNERVDMWVDANIHVKGRPEWIFIKIHTHGTQEHDMDTLLGDHVGNMFGYLESAYNNGTDYVLHYVSSRELYNIVKAAEAGESGNPDKYRDYILDKPAHLQSGVTDGTADQSYRTA